MKSIYTTRKIIRNSILLICLSLFSIGQLLAQQTYAIQVKQTKNYIPSNFKNLMGLGTLKSIKSKNIYKVRLDGYLTRQTAKKMLPKIRNKGYKDAFLVASKVLNHQKTLYTIQLGVFSNLNLNKFADVKKIFSKRNFYIEQKGNAFALYFGLYNSKKSGEEAKNLLAKRGIKGIIKSIGKTAKKTINTGSKQSKIVKRKSAVKTNFSNKKKKNKAKSAFKPVKNEIKPNRNSNNKRKKSKIKPKKTLRPIPSKKVLSPAEQEMEAVTLGIISPEEAAFERIKEAQIKMLEWQKQMKLDSIRRVKEAKREALRQKEQARKDSIKAIEDARRQKEQARRDSIRRVRKAKREALQRKEQARKDSIQAIKDERRRKEKERIAKIKRAKSRVAKSKPEAVVKAVPVTKNRPSKNKKPYLTEMKVGNYKFRLLGLEEDYSLSVSGIHIYYKGNWVQTINGLQANVPTSERNRCLIFEDMNFDGYRDLRLLEYLPVGLNVPYLCWTFDSKRTDFVYNYAISAIFAPKVDAKNKQIISYQKKSPSSYCRTYYKFFGKKLLPVQQDLEKYDGSDSYQLIISKRQEDGTMLEVESKVIQNN